MREQLHRFKHFMQIDSGDCAAVCLRSVANYYGHALTREDAEARVKKCSKGASLLDLKNALRDLQATVEIQWCSIGYIIKRNSFPCIVHMRGEHFVVLLGASLKSVIISDPSSHKNEIISVSHFAEDFVVDESGVGAVLFVEKFPLEKERIRSPNFLFLTLAKLFEAEAKRSFAVCLLAFIVIFMMALVPILTKVFFDRAVSLSGFGILIVAAGSLIGAQFCIVALNFARSVCSSIMQRNLISVFSESFLAKLVRLDYNFFLTRTSGDILQRLNDQCRLEAFASRILSDGLTIVCGLLGGVIGLILISPIGALATAVFTMLVFAISRILIRKRIVREQRYFDASAKARGSENEIARCILSIKAAAHETQAVANWTSSARKRAEAQLRLARFDALLMAISELLVQLAAVLILLLVTWPAMGSPLISAGDIGAFAIVMGTIFSPVIRLASISKDIQEAKLASERSENVLSIGASPKSTEGPRIELSEAAIQFRKVWYTYPGGRVPALRGVEFDIEANTTCAIVGGSGSGKSTVGLLLSKLLQPSQGDILIGNYSLSGIESSWLRSSIGYVLQDGAIYDGTISYNISGSENPDPETVWAALRICCLDEIVAALPRGISTIIGAGFEGLSGGQRQRILLARALFKNPSIIILDEATSALDVRTESRVLENLKRAFPTTTTIIIAHRASTLSHADKVICLKDGTVEWMCPKSELNYEGEQVTPLAKLSKCMPAGTDVS